MNALAAGRPSTSVLDAFGADVAPVLLAGGRGFTWRAGDIVLRPVEGDEEARWKSQVLSELAPGEGFTVPRPLRALDGDWLHEHWQAMEWVQGEADETRLADVIAAGAAFHLAVARHARPGFIAAAGDAWSRADRIAWSEEPSPADPLLRVLADAYRDVSSPAQVIHGDLLGNVLFAADRPPAIIDWAPYWRPAGYAAAVAAVDSVCWHGLSREVLGEDRGIPEWRQFLLRALAFRITTLHLLGVWTADHLARHAPIVRAVISLPET
ncbi:TIGR02569 family protein [Microbacterium sp. SA39]|uniref:TIGR02569 family protein n=1 Tax=Microbacterium sp. SA39 TaxID=1263625 RepID=UPI0005FA239E|nr:TIGR02569 family protein [Microbacterium sp. SA39]KJQ56078.1 hypothetical protein RS85_00059 [Microbacterium sp. SA39]